MVCECRIGVVEVGFSRSLNKRFAPKARCGIGGASLILVSQVSHIATRFVSRFLRPAILGSGLAVVMPFAAKADCTFGGPIGPGGAQFHSFLAATSNAATSTVTAMNTGFQTQTSAFVSSPSSSQPDQFASGVWARGIGGRMDVDSASTGTVTPNRVPPAGQVPPFPAACSTETRNDFVGFQAGYDLGRLDLGGSGWNGHYGVTGGFFQTQATSQQGSGITGAQVPFGGVYGALVKGGFFIDAQAVWQGYNLNVSEPSLAASGIMDGSGFGITSSTGYNFQLGGGWFIEPSASVIYSKVHLDPLQLNPLVLGTPTSSLPVTLASTIRLGDIETLPARVGVRVGTSFDAGGVALSPFATASVWHEFAGNTSASATFLPFFNGAPLTNAGAGAFSISSTRIGTFGQYSLGVNAVVPGTGWIGYARVDYRNGENIEALSVNGGIRYQFAPTPPVVAAPAPMYTKAVKAPPVAPPPLTWTGFYLGGFAGGAWAGHVTTTELAPGPGPQPFFNGIGTQTSYNTRASAPLAGLDFGYNYQIGAMVVGLEAEGGYLRVSGSAPFLINPLTTSTTTIGNWYTALTGRLGVAAGPVLFYGKGGAAIVDVTDSVISVCSTCYALPALKRNVTAAGGNQLGVTWAAGAGVEYALDPRWSLKGEYLALGTDASNTASGPGLVQCLLPVCANVPQNFNWRVDIPMVQTVKIGVNYKL
jgi:opacity protein-like surface antigen